MSDFDFKFGKVAGGTGCAFGIFAILAVLLNIALIAGVAYAVMWVLRHFGVV